nr:T9SS type A sorting domain-containing protein [Sphingomonadales bacterium]
STATGTITVSAPTSAGTLSGTQSICVNGTTTFASTVSGGSWSSSATGVATVNASTGVVTGVAAGTATITYTVTGTGGCADATATRTVTVNSNNTITLSSASGTNAQTVTVNTAITNITYSTTGATGATISGLPAGVTGSWASNVVTISGTPTATGTFNYTVTMTGGCTGGNNTATGSITVNPGGGGGNFNIQTTIGSFNSSTCAVGDTIVLPITVNMASGISTAAISMAIDYDTTKLRCINSVTSLNANIATGFLSNCGFFNNANPNPPYTSSSRRQFRAAWFNLVPVSFNGVMFNLRFVVESTGNSVIKWDLVNIGNCEYADELADVIPNCSFVDGSITCGSAAPANCGITLSSGTGTANQSVCQGSAITNITYATTAATGATVIGLPAGVTGVWASNAVTISGTPTAAGTFNYTVTLTGCTGGTSTATGTITVAAPTSAGTLSGTQSICIAGTTTFASTVSGGSWSSSAVGVATVNASTGVVTGVAAGTATITYTVTGTGGCANATATRTLTVTAPASAGTLSGTQNICIAGTTTFTSTVSGGSWSSSATGVATVNATTGLVTGIAAGTATITYTVTGTGGCSNATATRTVTVNPNSSSTLSDTICQGNTYLFGTLALTSSGTYNRTLPSWNGCDSLITLNLVVINKPQAPSISVSGTVDTLFANPGNRVTWFRNGVQIGAGSTGFIPITQNGQYYALRDTSVGSRICYSDTSNRLNLSNVGIGEQVGQSKLLRVYPVPASDIIYVEGIEEGSSLELQVFDLSGRRVTSLSFNSTDVENRIQVNTSGLPAGMYQVFLKGNQWSTVQLIKFSILR